MPQLVTRAPIDRKAELAAVGMTGEHQIEAVGGELVKDRRLGRMQDAKAQVGGRVG